MRALPLSPYREGTSSSPPPSLSSSACKVSPPPPSFSSQSLSYLSLKRILFGKLTSQTSLQATKAAIQLCDPSDLYDKVT